MIVEEDQDYLDSHGRRFRCDGFGRRSPDTPHGVALDPRPKRPRRILTAFFAQHGGLDVYGARLVCPYPANDWWIVAFAHLETPKIINIPKRGAA